MKKSTLKLFMVGLMASGLLTVTSCSKDDTSEMLPNANQQSMRLERDLIFPFNANMYGKSYDEWTKEWWKWLLSFNCATFPGFDATGALQNQNQSGPVFFLSGRRNFDLTVTVPAGKSIFLPLITLGESYPNATGGRVPLPGQTGEVFLDSLARLYASEVGACSIVIDGVEFTGMENAYKTESIGPYTNIANPDLANCYNPGFTVDPQLFNASGVHVMLKPLTPGQHTIVRKALFRGLYFEFRYTINQL